MKEDQLEYYYYGATAEGYDQKRSVTEKWQLEQKAVELLLKQLPEELDLIDIPVGTGRFFDLFAVRSDKVLGVDISSDMLDLASKHAAAPAVKLDLTQGNIFNLDLEPGSFDCAICIRFLNLVNSQNMARAIKELSRVSRLCVIVGIRFIPCGHVRIALIRWCLWKLRWVWLTFVRYRKGKVFFHSEQQVCDGIKNACLTVQNEFVIENSQNGTRYVIYMLVPENS